MPECKVLHVLLFFVSKDIQPLKQKTIVVLQEVTELVTRLEKERKEAEEGLELERCRRRKLYHNSDNLSRWRLQHLPIAVQEGMKINCIEGKRMEMLVNFISSFTNLILEGRGVYF